MPRRGIIVTLVLFLLSANVLLLVYLGVLKFGAAASGQSLSELRGTITDETGAVIIDALLVLEGNGRGYSTKTDNKGWYRFLAIAPGTYTLTVTAKGFAKHKQEADLTSRRIALINVTLKVFISETLEVKSGAPKISTDPDNNLSSIVLTGKAIQTLPDDQLSMLEVLRRMACPSCRPEDVAIYVDGFRNNDTGRGAHRLPPKVAIEMIRINANPFAAEFSEPGKGRIEITTKPGSDAYHGEAKFDFNDESLNARNAFAPSRPPVQVRNYSGYLSGPAIRNRLDYLAYAGRWEQDENATVNALVIDPNTHMAQPFSTTVLTLSRTTNLTLHLNYLLGKKHTAGVEYGYTLGESLNQAGGLDLPERASKQSSREAVLRFSLTSIFDEHTIGETRLELARRISAAQSLSNQPAILVLDAFNAGGNQSSLFTRNYANSLQLASNLTRIYKKHTFKTGLMADTVALRDMDKSNFGGTFTFGSDFERDVGGNIMVGSDGRPVVITPIENYRRTLLKLPGYGPSQFSIIRGDPTVGLTQWNMGYFLQDDWRISPRLTLSYGLRHDFQTHLKNKLNFAPRAAMAWTPDKQQKSAVRIGTGIFYSAVYSDITLEATKLDGRHQQELTIPNPSFFPEVPARLDGAIASLQTIHRKSADLRSPYLIISTISYERQLPRNLYGSIGYTWQRGVNLLRMRNINAPDSTNVRSLPDRGPILQFESTGTSTRHELLLALRASIGRRVTLFSNYTLSSTHSDTDGAYTAPANSYDLSTEFGYASLDERHNFFIGGTFTLPWGLIVSPYIFVTSGQPFNITTGRDGNGDTLFSDRPAFARLSDPGAVATRFGVFNPTPGPDDWIIPRNFGRGQGRRLVNLNLMKSFTFGLPGAGSRSSPNGSGQKSSSERRRYNLTLSANVENLFNHTNFGEFNGVLTSPLFGRPNHALNARRIQISLGLSF
jgi:hypothetical protein